MLVYVELYRLTAILDHEHQRVATASRGMWVGRLGIPVRNYMRRHLRLTCYAVVSDRPTHLLARVMNIGRLQDQTTTTRRVKYTLIWYMLSNASTKIVCCWLEIFLWGGGVTRSIGFLMAKRCLDNEVGKPRVSRTNTYNKMEWYWVHTDRTDAECNLMLILLWRHVLRYWLW